MVQFYSDLIDFSVLRDNIRKNDRKPDLKINEQTELEIIIKKEAPARPSFPEASSLWYLVFWVDSVPDSVVKLNSLGIATEPIRFDDYTGKKMTFPWSGWVVHRDIWIECGISYFEKRKRERIWKEYMNGWDANPKRRTIYTLQQGYIYYIYRTKCFWGLMIWQATDCLYICLCVLSP